MENSFNHLVQSVRDVTANSIAKILWAKYEPNYRCASIKQNKWYEFKIHRWQLMKTTQPLKNLLYDYVVNEYIRYQVYLYNLSINPQYNRKQCLLQALEISDIIKKIVKGNGLFERDVMNEFSELAYDPYFINNLDQDPNLIGFKNGIYDMKLGNIRPGKPNDYVSLSTGYDYIEYDDNNIMIARINELLDKYLPEFDMKICLLKMFASYLSGQSQTDDNSTVHIICGENSSMFSYVLCQIMGEYCRNVNTFNEELLHPSFYSGVRLYRLYIDGEAEINNKQIFFNNRFVITYGRNQMGDNQMLNSPYRLLISCDNIDLITMKWDNNVSEKMIKIIQLDNSITDGSFYKLLNEKNTEFKKCFMAILIKYNQKNLEEYTIHSAVNNNTIEV